MKRAAHTHRRIIIYFLSIISILVIVGLVSIYSASSVFALERYGSASYYVHRQCYGLIISIIVGILCACIPYTYFRFGAPLFFITTLIATVLPLIASRYGTTVHGSTRWLTLGPYAIQPSEFLKVAVILMLARLLNNQRGTLYTVRHYTSMGIIIISSAIIMLIQPDFGQAVLVTGTSICMILITLPHLKTLAISSGIGAAAAILLIVTKPYRLKRILTFLNPWDDPQGAGFQIIQSFIALGSGGITGIGIGKSHQKFFYLPMQHTDFIFPIIAEETGFIGSLFVITLFIGLLYTGYTLAWSRKDTFSLLTIFGFITMISLQAIINLAVVTGLAPTKGIGLPLISYGVSSLLAHGCIVGIIVSCAKNRLS